MEAICARGIRTQGWSFGPPPEAASALRSSLTSNSSRAHAPPCKQWGDPLSFIVSYVMNRVRRTYEFQGIWPAGSAVLQGARFPPDARMVRGESRDLRDRGERAV